MALAIYNVMSLIPSSFHAIKQAHFKKLVLLYSMICDPILGIGVYIPIHSLVPRMFTVNKAVLLKSAAVGFDHSQLGRSALFIAYYKISHLSWGIVNTGG